MGNKKWSPKEEETSGTSYRPRRDPPPPQGAEPDDSVRPDEDRGSFGEPNVHTGPITGWNTIHPLPPMPPKVGI